MAQEVVLRQEFCRGLDCGAMFYIYHSCYLGQAYCGDRCRQKKRRQQRRDANRRHQQSQEGRLDHRDRQRDYRQRCRRRVTDHTSTGRARIRQHQETINGNGNEHAINGGISQSAPI